MVEILQFIFCSKFQLNPASAFYVGQEPFQGNPRPTNAP